MAAYYYIVNHTHVEYLSLGKVVYDKNRDPAGFSQIEPDALAAYLADNACFNFEFVEGYDFDDKGYANNYRDATH